VVDVSVAFKQDYQKFMVPLEMETKMVQKHNMRRYFYLDKIGLLDGENILVQTKDPNNARFLTLF